jgi:hypothetical protein
MAKYVVCPECEGEGYIGTLGSFTASELSEWYDETDDYLSAHEASKTACAFCEGNRVVTDVRDKEYAEYLEYQAERAAESRYCGGY